MSLYKKIGKYWNWAKNRRKMIFFKLKYIFDSYFWLIFFAHVTPIYGMYSKFHLHLKSMSKKRKNFRSRTWRIIHNFRITTTVAL